MIKKYGLTTLAIILTFSLLLGCTKKSDEHKEELKEELIAAIVKQSEINNYRFAGSADLSLDVPALTGVSQDPLTAGLTSALTNGAITWQGVTDIDAARMEVDLKITPNELGATFDVPALVNNSKLYIQIPLLVADEEEYLTFDLENNMASLPFTTILMQIIESTDAKFFTRLDNENESGKMIALQIQPEHFNEFATSMQQELPFIITELEKSSLINAKLAEQWHQIDTTIADKFQLDQTAIVDFTIDDTGFIVEQNVSLHFDHQSMILHNRLTEINQSAPFVKEIPGHVRPIENILEQFR